MKESGLFHFQLVYFVAYIDKIAGFMQPFAGARLKLPIYVYGPETHMTSIVASALGLRPPPDTPVAPQTTGQFLLQPERNVNATTS